MQDDTAYQQYVPIKSKIHIERLKNTYIQILNFNFVTECSERPKEALVSLKEVFDENKKEGKAEVQTILNDNNSKTDDHHRMLVELSLICKMLGIDNRK